MPDSDQQSQHRDSSYRCSNLRSDDLGPDYEDVGTQSQCKRNRRVSHKPAADAMKLLRILALIDDPMIGGRSHEENNAQRDEEQRRAVHHL